MISSLNNCYTFVKQNNNYVVILSIKWFVIDVHISLKYSCKSLIVYNKYKYLQ